MNNELTPESIQVVVQEYLKPINSALQRMADAMADLGKSQAEMLADSRANEQKFIRVYERQDETDRAARDLDAAMLTLTTKVIPEIEQQIAKNTLSTGIFWKGIFLFVGPLCSGMGAMFLLFHNAQKANMAAQVLNQKAQMDALIQILQASGAL